MRALLDTNVLISYLLPGQQERPITAIVEAAIAGTFSLLLPAEVVTELRAKVATKEYPRARIPGLRVEALVARLASVAEVLPSLGTNNPVATRDAKDDYLLANALYGRADYLVTRDRDLLVLRAVAGVQIVSPAEFARLLQAPTQP